MTKLIPLTKGQFAIVDDADFDWLSQWKWLFSRYARRAKGIAMHRVIMNAPDDMEVDHINHNVLDNRRENLRLATCKQNRMNRSKHKITRSSFKGLHWRKDRSRWVARIKVNREFIYLGTFINELDAAQAYDTAARIYHGEFACTNF